MTTRMTDAMREESALLKLSLTPDEARLVARCVLTALRVGPHRLRVAQNLEQAVFRKVGDLLNAVDAVRRV